MHWTEWSLLWFLSILHESSLSNVASHHNICIIINMCILQHPVFCRVLLVTVFETGFILNKVWRWILKKMNELNQAVRQNYVCSFVISSPKNRRNKDVFQEANLIANWRMLSCWLGGSYMPTAPGCKSWSRVFYKWLGRAAGLTTANELPWTHVMARRRRDCSRARWDSISYSQVHCKLTERCIVISDRKTETSMIFRTTSQPTASRAARWKPSSSIVDIVHSK